MPTDAALLAAVPIFNGLSETARAELAEALAEERAPAGTTLVNYGDPGGSMYIIRSGTAEIYIKNDTGERVLLETVGEGGFFGEISLLDQGPRTASVVVTEDLNAVRLD